LTAEPHPAGSGNLKDATMSTGNPPALDPFLQRSSAEIAADVGAAAIRVLDQVAYTMPLTMSYVIGGDSEQAAEATEALPTDLLVLAEEMEALGATFDKVTGWWIADHPPACNPKARSVVEALLREAAHMRACFEVPDLADVRSRCTYAELLRRRLDEAEWEAVLCCEVASMARRPPPNEGLRSFWEQVLPVSGLIDSKYLNSSARSGVSNRLPTGWRAMSREERGAAVDRMWESVPPRAGVTGSAPRRPRPDTTHQIRILALLDGRAMKQAQLAKALGVSAAQLHRPGYLRELREAGRVVSDRKLGGYYRPDAPPQCKRPHLGG
jgi:hypothetical protein